MIAQGREERLHSKDWLLVGATALIAVSILLTLLARQVFGATSFETLLWAVFLSFWTYVLSVAGFFVLLVGWFRDCWHGHKHGADTNELFPAFCR
jgi:hypothetical protein